MTFFNDELLADLAVDLPLFIASLQQLETKLQFSLGQYHADHISVRCHQNTTAERWREGLQRCGHLLSEKMINGRPICLFTLNEPLQVGEWKIECVELPYPGEKRYPKEGWEHIELVLPVGHEALHQTALELLSDDVLLDRSIKLKFSHPKGEGERLPNPTLAVTDGTVTVKFHPYSIQDVVESERD